MVNGTFEEILADPVAGQFVCSPDAIGAAACFSDFSGRGVCNPQRQFGDEAYDDLFTVDLVHASSITVIDHQTFFFGLHI